MDLHLFMELPVVFVLFFFIIVGRFFLVAGLFHFYFYVLGKKKWASRRLSRRDHERGQFRRELKWSMISALIFSLAGTMTYVFWMQGWTRLYIADEYPFWWIPVSLLLIFFLHETYYYWIHRWMHIPSVFGIIHKVHHESHITSPWTAFAFHPLEAVLQALIIPVLILLIPLHIYALLFVLIVMTFSSVINHLGVEVYPGWFQQHWLLRMFIGATHHSRHHRQYRYNFGLYFTFWDRWGNTEYEEIKDQKSKIQKAGPGL